METTYCTQWQILCTDLKVKSQSFFCYAASPLCILLFRWLCTTPVSRFSNFKYSFWNTWKIVACHLLGVQTDCEILLLLRLLETHCKSSIFVLLAFLLLQEEISHMQSLHAPHNCPWSWLPRVVVSDCKREFVKPLEWLFGLFRSRINVMNVP